MLLNPKRGVREYPDEASREMMLAVIDFFESKGLARIKHDDHERVWYQDFLEFVKDNRVFFTCLTPPEYGDEGCRWDTWRNCELNEILGFYGLAYWYTWQVTILGPRPHLDEQQRGGQAADGPVSERGRHLRFRALRTGNMAQTSTRAR